MSHIYGRNHCLCWILHCRSGYGSQKKPVIDFHGTDIRTELAVVNCFENSFESYIDSITDCVRVIFFYSPSMTE